MGLAVNAGISISYEERQKIPHSRIQMLIPALTGQEPHEGCPRFAMNASNHLTHSFAFSAFLMEISFSTVGFENDQNLKLIFEKNP